MRVEAGPRACEGCGAEFERRHFPNGRLEELARFVKRRFCSRGCYRSAAAKGGVQRLPGVWVKEPSDLRLQEVLGTDVQLDAEEPEGDGLRGLLSEGGRTRSGSIYRAQSLRTAQGRHGAPAGPLSDREGPEGPRKPSAFTVGRSGGKRWSSVQSRTTSVASEALAPDDWRRAVYGANGSNPSAPRRRPRAADRERILRAQGEACLYCEIPIGTSIGHVVTHRRRPQRTEQVVLRAAWDHFVPYSYALQNPELNWVLACHVCNGIKWARMFTTVTNARAVILPRRLQRGYEDAKRVLRRLELNAAAIQAGRLPQPVTAEAAEEPE